MEYNDKVVTPDISNVIQEVVDRGGWSSGNAMLIQIDNWGTSSGNRRTAESYNGESSNAPELRIVYSVGATSTDSPTFDATGGPHNSGTYRFNGVDECFRSTNDVNSGDGNNIGSAPNTTALWFKTAAAVGSTDQHLVSFEGSGTCPSCDYYRIYLEANTGKNCF
ncbi:MAG: hypothetical protein HC944_04650 [Nanoarchaeota archaeon]|nr:hypothetical protein [Nanoarchaeota archaeon]